MLSKEVEERIRAGKACRAYAVITTEDMGKSCTIFDDKLGKLARSLENICADICWNCNSSSEKYEVHFPKGMIVEVRNRVIEALSKSGLSIKPEWGFGALA